MIHLFLEAYFYPILFLSSCKAIFVQLQLLWTTCYANNFYFLSISVKKKKKEDIKGPFKNRFILYSLSWEYLKYFSCLSLFIEREKKCSYFLSVHCKEDFRFWWGKLTGRFRLQGPLLLFPNFLTVSSSLCF